MHQALLLEVRGRDNQMLQKGLSVKHQTLYPYQRHISNFLTKSICTVLYYSLSGDHLLKNFGIYVNIILSKTFVNACRILTGFQLSFNFFTLIYIKVARPLTLNKMETEDLKVLLVFLQKKSANLFTLSLIILVVMSKNCESLSLFN